jgi:hypothetical protein
MRTVAVMAANFRRYAVRTLPGYSSASNYAGLEGLMEIDVW